MGRYLKLVMLPVIVGSTFGNDHPYHLAAQKDMSISNCAMLDFDIWAVQRLPVTRAGGAGRWDVGCRALGTKVYTINS